MAQVKECQYEPNKRGVGDKGIRQTDLIHRLGKSFNIVNLYAANKLQPQFCFIQIADILNVDVRYLLIPQKISR